MRFFKINVSMNSDDFEFLKHAAEEQRQSRSAYIREAIYIRRQLQLMFDSASDDAKIIDKLVVILKRHQYDLYGRKLRRAYWQKSIKNELKDD